MFNYSSKNTKKEKNYKLISILICALLAVAVIAFLVIAKVSSSSLTPEWVSKSFPIIKFILLCLIVLSAIALIVVVLMQETDNENGGNAITGIKDTYYSRNKGMNKEGRLKKITLILSIFIAIAVLVFFVMTEIYSPSLWSVVS